MVPECKSFHAKEPLLSPDGPCLYWVGSRFQNPGYCSKNAYPGAKCPTLGLVRTPRPDSDSDGEPD